MTRTVLHMADVHLDASFASSGLPPTVGARRRQDLCEALKRALSLARKHRVDAVTIAGDLYDGRYALPETGTFLAAAFGALAPIPVIVAPGRADPSGDDSLYALTRWPDNVTVMPPGPPTAVRVAPDLTIWGAAWSPEAPPELPSVGEAGEGRHLLLLHAGEADTGGDGPPLLGGTTPAALRAAGWTYALLGGNHGGAPWPQEDPCGCFPGSLEPLAPAEASARHGAVLVRIAADGGCAAEWLEVGRWRYASVTADLGGCASADEAARRIEAALRHDRVRTDPRAIASVSVTGAPEEGLDLDEIRALVERRAQLTIRAVRPFHYDLDQLAQERTVRGLLVRRLRALVNDESPPDHDHHAGDAMPGPSANLTLTGDLTMNALYLALQALDGKGVRPGEIA